MKAFVIAVVLLTLGSAPWGAKRAGAQGVDSSCLVLWQDSPDCPCNYDPSFVWFNDDSVKVDMCSGSQYLEMFAMKKFGVYFLYYIFPDSLAPIADSLDHDWSELDSSYFMLRNAFDSIEKRFGPFTIQHEADFPDSLKYIGDTVDDIKEWRINFKTYVNVDSALNYLGQLPDGNPNFKGPHGEAYFEGRPGGYEGISEKKDDSLKFWPLPCARFLYVQGAQEPKQIIFYSVLGQRVFPTSTLSDGLQTFDFSNMRDGLYFMEASERFFKLIVQR